jgi:glutamine amidotransferase-like uncharacterized protein
MRYLAFLTVLIAAPSLAALKPVALVYRGPGACEEGCSEAAAYVAQRAGLYAIYVGPQDDPAQVFADPEVAVWVQPGGISREAARAMRPDLKEAIRAFVQRGGGYVGFCAGGFLATSLIGETDVPGLGLVPGRSHLYEQVSDDATILSLSWPTPRQTYWEGGPYFYGGQAGAKDSAAFEVLATYPDGSAASVRNAFGLGRVFVTGAHPEAPQGWRSYYQLTDSDGLDYDLAVAMIQWVRGL